MKIKPLVRFSTALALALTAGSNAHATDYLITATAPVSGAQYSDPERYRGAFKHKPFTYLENWWTSWDELNRRVTLKSGDNVYFGPDVYIGDDITISTSGINLYGNNKDCLGWYGNDTQNKSAKTRLAETHVTGRITLAQGVSNVTISGFHFTGNGQVYANCSNSNPISNIKLLNNVIESIYTTSPDPESSTNKAVFYFGDAYRNSAATNTAAYNRYGNIEIAHNDFRGQDINNEADWIQVAGSYGTLNIHDNHFNYGGDGVNVFNATGKVNILHNRFDKVGNDKAYGTARGSFAVRLFYLGQISSCPVDVYVRHNVFDGCQGQSSKYSIIRVYNKDAAVQANTVKLYINHNHFKNKTTYVNEAGSATDGTNLVNINVEYKHYYVYFADSGANKPIDVDWRFNRFDNSELEFAYLVTPWDRAHRNSVTPGRYYASLSEVFEHTTAEYSTADEDATGTQCDFYGKKHADGTYFGGYFSGSDRDGAIDYIGGDYERCYNKNQHLPNTVQGRFRPGPNKTSTVVQSFDRDDETGDLYFVQVRNGDNGNTSNDDGPTSTCKKPLLLTHLSRNGSKEYMYLDYAGHGSNLAVYRYKDQVYAFMGGNQADKDKSDPTQILIFPFVASGNNIGLNNNSFTIGQTTHKIAHKNPSLPIGSIAPNGKTVQSFVYPSIDHANNLYVERQRTEGGDYFTVYEASDVFNSLYLNGGSTQPKIIGRCYIAAGAEKIGSTSTSGARPQLNTYDQGFKTWDDQGFTIAGDYIYTFEGNGDDDTSHPDPDEKDGKGAVQLINCINWRNGTFMYRRHINKESTYNTALKYPGEKQADGTYKNRKLDGPAKLTAGEPEGIKVFRDHTGRAQLVIGIVNGDAAQSGVKGTGRHYNLFCYRQKRGISNCKTEERDVIGREFTKTAYKGYTKNIPDAELTPNTNLVTFSGNTVQTQNVKFENNGEARNVHATIVGEHSEYFTLTPHTSYYANGTDLSLLPTDAALSNIESGSWARTNRDYDYNTTLTYTKGSNTEHTGEHTYDRGYTLTFNPSKYLRDYDKAWVKLSSPGAQDLYIPIRATYTGQVTSVENVINDNGLLEVEGYYDLTGRRVENPEGFVIVRYTNGTAEKKFIH